MWLIEVYSYQSEVQQPDLEKIGKKNLFNSFPGQFPMPHVHNMLHLSSTLDDRKNVRWLYTPNFKIT